MALPKFARNYGRSGAYENPQTIVDTKTGAIWGNAIQNIGNSIASTIEGVTKNAALEVQKTQKILDENAKFVLENYYGFLKQVTSKNQSFNNLALDIIRKKGEAYTKMRRGDQKASEDFATYSSKLSELISYWKAGVNAKESFTSDFIDGYSKVNTPGGVSTVGIDTVRSMNYQLAMPAKIGGTPNGYETWYMDNDLNIRTRYTSDQIGKNFKDGTIKNAYIDANPLDIYTFDPGVVDNIRKETLEYFNQAGIVKNNVIGNGFLQDKIDVVQSGDVKYNYQKIDMAKVTGSTRDFINAKATTYLKRPSAANNLWNHQLQQGRNILGPDGKPLYPDGFKLKLANGQIGTTFDTETSKVFTEALAQYMYDILPEGKQSSVRDIKKGDDDSEKTQPFAVLTEQAWQDGGKEKIIESFFSGSKEDISLTVTDFIKQVGAPNKIEGFSRASDSDKSPAIGIKIGVTGRRAGETIEILATESPNKILGKIQYALTGDETYLLP